MIRIISGPEMEDLALSVLLNQKVWLLVQVGVLKLRIGIVPAYISAYQRWYKESALHFQFQFNRATFAGTYLNMNQKVTGRIWRGQLPACNFAGKETVKGAKFPIVSIIDSFLSVSSKGLKTVKMPFWDSEGNIHQVTVHFHGFLRTKNEIKLIGSYASPTGFTRRQVAFTIRKGGKIYISGAY